MSSRVRGMVAPCPEEHDVLALEARGPDRASMARFSPTSGSASRRTGAQAIREAIPQIAWTVGPGGVEYFDRGGSGRVAAPDPRQAWDWLALVHPDDAEQARQHRAEAARTDSPLELECRIRGVGDSFRWHAVAGLPLRGDDGQITRWIYTATDIDARKHVRDRVRRIEREHLTSEALLSMAPVALGLVDPELRWVRVNEELAAINAVPAGDHLGRRAAELMPAIWAQLAPLCGHVLETGEAVRGREIVEGSPAEGEGPRSWQTSCYPVEIHDEGMGVGIVLVDVTDQHRQTDEFCSVVLAHIAEGLYISDHQGRFTFVNAAAEAMLGWSAQELRAKHVHDTIDFQRADGSPLPDEGPGLREAGDRVVQVSDHAFTRKDGSIFPVTYSAIPLTGSLGSRGTVVMFRDTSAEEADHEQVKRQLDALSWIGRTRDALDEGRVVLYSQPIVPLSGGEPSQELLLRMVGRGGEIIRPATFLPSAEKYGLINEIDQRVVKLAATVAAGGRRVQANLSALSISSQDLLPQVERALSEAGASPANLVFEITETALMEDPDAGEAFARGVAAIGCHLALDDFGTGYGSFTRLKRLPITYLKIDIEFVRDIVSNPDDRSVVAAIVGLARGFGQQTIAEGVEDAETLALLGECGVDFAQGYHLGRPAPLPERAAA